MPMRTVKEVFQEHEGLARILNNSTLAPYADAAVELAEETDARGQVAAACQSMIGAVLEDAGLNIDDRLTRIREVLHEHDSFCRPEGPPAGDTLPASNAASRAPEPPAGDGAPGPDAATRQLLERLDRLETEAACRALLESHGRACDATRLKALAALSTEDDRLKLIESWPDRTSQTPHRIPARPVVSRPLNETGETVTLPKHARALALALR